MLHSRLPPQAILLEARAMFSANVHASRQQTGSGTGITAGRSPKNSWM
jgi:hypothetical protein